MRKNIRLAEPKAPAKKKPAPHIPPPVLLKKVQLSPIEALELRQIEFSVVSAQAALQTLVNIRQKRAEAIGKEHGIDINTGSWHLDADAGTITALPPKE